MAQWCSNCLKQQTQVKALHELMGETPDFISVGLDADRARKRRSVEGIRGEERL